MAVLLSKADGSLVQFYQNADAATGTLIPPNAANILVFDEGVNPTAISLITTDWNNCSLQSGTLSHNGTPVQIILSSQVFLDKTVLANLKQILVNYVQNQTPTGADTVQAVKALIRLFAITYG